jgi:hypothetical protein
MVMDPNERFVTTIKNLLPFLFGYYKNTKRAGIKTIGMGYEVWGIKYKATGKTC